MEHGEFVSFCRVSALVAMLLLSIAAGVPFTRMLGMEYPNDLVGNVSASLDDYELSVGCSGVDYVLETLNPLYYVTPVHDLLGLCYSTLTMYDVSGSEFLGDLAISWEVSSNGTQWHFKIHDDVCFYDRRETVQDHHVTVDDIIFTYWLIQNTSNNLARYLQCSVNNSTTGVIEEMWSDGPYDVYIQTRIQNAPLLIAFTEIPILPMYYWEGTDFSEFENELLIGSGPFYYGLTGLPVDGEIVFHRNPIWFQEDVRGWQIHVGTLKFSPYPDPDAAYMALTEDDPEVDVVMNVPAPTYLDTIPYESPSKALLRFASSDGFVYEFNLNQLTDELRESAGGSLLYGTNNPLLRDPAVKRAIAMCVDKQSFVYDVLGGLGTVANSLVPDVNPWHFEYGLDTDETPFEFAPLQARENLIAAGWAYDSEGNPCDETTLPLCRVGGSDPLDFRFITLDNPEVWENGAQQLVDWCAMAGVRFNLELRPTYSMNVAWYSGDYDAWLYCWAFRPFSDPSQDILQVLTTSAIRSWSDVFYSNQTFDSLYNQSMQELDPEVRGLLVDEMQRMAYEDASCQLVAYRKDLYAVTEKRWTNYGNWSESYLLRPEIGLPWLYMRVSPVSNMAPIVQVADGFSGDVGIEIPVSAILSDDSSSVEYRWFWGDGSSTGWIAGVDGLSGHVYEEGGCYSAYIAAREDGGDGFITWNHTVICVFDESNTPPHPAAGFEEAPITYLPDDPCPGDIIEFTSHFIDSEDDTLTYMWDFGDSSFASGSVTGHRYLAPGIYTVTLSVTDNQMGSSERPVVVHVSVAVESNTEPTIEVGDYPEVFQDIPTVFSVAASDDDLLRFTWDWGDGEESVTDTNSAVHTYILIGDYVLTVYADDLSGIPGHNVSDTGNVVVSIANYEPSVEDLQDLTVLVNTTVSFYADASDPDGDDLSIWWDFGDGSAIDSGADVTHMYTLPGMYDYHVYVDDGYGHNVTKTATITVNAEPINLPPEIAALDDRTSAVHEIVEFTATATDPDDDALVYTWDFGDGSDFVVGQIVEHAYDAAGEYTFMVHVDDGAFNESAEASITVSASAPPVADAGTNQVVTVGMDVTFDGSGSADDVGIVNFTWTFEYDGDEVIMYGVAPSHTFEVAGEYKVTLTVKDSEGQTDADYVTITVDEDDSGKTFMESYGVAMSALAVGIAAAAVALFVLKGRKGGKLSSSSDMDGISSGGPEEHESPPN